MMSILQIVAGSYCTYGVRYDGSVCSVGEGTFGRLGHGGSDSESSMRTLSALQGMYASATPYVPCAHASKAWLFFCIVGIPIVHIVGGPRVTSYSEEGFALALTHSGDIYSWGKGYKGRLGHPITENVRTPKLIEALASKNIKMVKQVMEVDSNEHASIHVDC